jgi:HEAT repeat protein
VADLAIRTLVERAHPVAWDILLLRLGSSDPEMRFFAVGELTVWKTPEAEALLVEAGTDPDPQVAQAAVRHLAERGHPASRDLILGLLRRVHPAWLRYSALWDAGVMDISPYLEQAWTVLNHREWLVRCAGAGALAKAHVVSSLPRLRGLMDRADKLDQDVAVAHLAGCAAILGDDAAATKFLACMSSRRRWRRGGATAWLQRRGRLAALLETTGFEALHSALLTGRQMNEDRIPEHQDGEGGYWNLYRSRFDRLIKCLETMAPDGPTPPSSVAHVE